MENSDHNVTSFNCIGLQETSDTPKNIQLNHRSISKLRHETQTFKKTWNMNWHQLRYKEVPEKLRVYWDRGMNNDSDHFTKHHPPIHHHIMRHRCIHKFNLVRKIPRNKILCKVVLNRFLSTQSCIQYDSMKPIQVVAKSMTHTNVQNSYGQLLQTLHNVSR